MVRIMVEMTCEVEPASYFVIPSRKLKIMGVRRLRGGRMTMRHSESRKTLRIAVSNDYKSIPYQSPMDSAGLKMSEWSGVHHLTKFS